MHVDIKECEFVRTPIVVTNVKAYNDFPNIHLRQGDHNSFTVFTDEGVKAKDANDQGSWQFSWVAYGHVC